MLYHVFKLDLDDATVAAVYSKGWKSTPEGAAYEALQFAEADNPDLAGHVMAAALLGLYHHGLSAEAKSLEHVFDYDNNAPYNTGVEPLYHCRGLHSMSVGDVVVSRDGVDVCCGNGWKALPKHAAAAFAAMAKRISCQRPNALSDAA